VPEAGNGRPLVGHVVDEFLHLSETFIYGYLSNLSATRAVVFARGRVQEQVFPFSPVDLYWTRPPLPARGLLRAGRWFDPRLDEHLQRLVLATRAALRRPQALHGHFGPMGMRALLARRRLGIPLVVSFYGIDMSYFPRLPEYAAELKVLFQQADMFIAIGERMKARLIELGCPAERLRIVHVGADMTRFTYRPRVRVPGEPVRFLFCGRFVEKKGIPFLLRAFALVRSQVPDVELTIIGDGGLRPEVERLIGELGISPATRLLGMQPYPRVAAEMERTHLLVGPSVTAENGDDEGGILTCGLEGSAAGIPLIATRHADIPEQLIDGENGLMVEERDVDGLAAAMTTLARAPERWPGMGAAGRKLIEERFEIRKETVALEKVYAELIEGSRP
jgi:colanic acid/amylovoran biosynthesis glycosyltransferase